MIRSVNSDKTSLDLDKTYNQPSDVIRRSNLWKPHGLWYQLNNDWVEWCSREMPEWVKPNNLELSIDMGKIKTIRTMDELMKFIKTFGYRHELTRMHFIDWVKVTRYYHGFEVQNFQYLKSACMFFYFEQDLSL